MQKGPSRHSAEIHNVVAYSTNTPTRTKDLETSTAVTNSDRPGYKDRCSGDNRDNETLRNCVNFSDFFNTEDLQNSSQPCEMKPRTKYISGKLNIL